jgi:hypothetical protein
MASPMKFEINGMKELAEKLRKLGDQDSIDAAVETAVTEAGEVMTDRLVANAPEASKFYPQVPKGFLKEHVNMKVLKIKEGFYSVFCGADPHQNYPPRKSKLLTKAGKRRKRPLKVAKYARGPWLPLVSKWLEFGKHGKAAHPWIRPVWNQTWRRSLDTMISALRDWLNGATR